MDIVTRKQLNILIQLAEADKHFAQVEREMIMRIARNRNYPEEAVEQLIRNPEPIESLGALTDERKFAYLLDCIELVFADQRVFESEVIFCRSIAIKLGFRKNVVDFLMQNHSTLPKEELKTTTFAQYT
ncbi:MAG: hypothetical protein K1X47_15710 [Cyclobacteriaceae bacterium]|nr:hypothetical protein [Cyclobacteriaceae bacterium]